ncbi:ATP-binding protein [Streptomyces sp. NPDC005496]|uniref:ATP-binding protein n=1 Tax=unclassified Streptomyces TaxID=2593676 RepID=UPI0033BEEB67
MNQETHGPRPQLAHPPRNFSVLLSPTPRGARLARLLAVEQLRCWELPSARTAHIVAELAANAVTHGRVPGRDFRLTLYVVGDTLRVEVTDTRGDRLPALPREVSPESASGRGLLLVDALADRWGVSSGPPPRKTVWAEVRITGPGSAGEGPPDPGVPDPGVRDGGVPRDGGGRR